MLGTPATGGTVTEGTGRLWLSATGTTQTKFIIYADASGTPGALLATSDEVNLSATTEAAVSFPFSGAQQIVVVANTGYWIGEVWKDPGTPGVIISRDNTGTKRYENTLTYPTLPDPFGAPSGTLSGPMDAFITYTETVAGGAVNTSFKTLLGVGNI